MISHKHKCIFIHIPKCAGTSIETALGHFDNHTGRDGQDHRSIRMVEKPIVISNILSSEENIIDFLRRVRHIFRGAENPYNKFTITKEQYDSYFKFTFVRNPWSRAYSWYKNVMRDEIHKKNHKITEKLSLNEFLRLYSGKGMLKPQLYWIKNFAGNIPLDYVGRFETLLEDFEKIREAIHAPGITLPHKTKGQVDDYRAHYDEDSIKMIMENYKEEIEMFGYSFDS